MLVEMLNILEKFDLAALGHNSAEYLRVVAEAMKRATIDKDRHVGDPDFFDVPVERLTGKDYAAALAAEIAAGQKADVPRFNTGTPGKDTTHISVHRPRRQLRDHDALARHAVGRHHRRAWASCTTAAWRCSIRAPAAPARSRRARRGSPRSCPSIVFKDGKPYLVIGAPGATQIAMGVLQAILNVLDFGMTMTEAVSAARFSATSNAIDVSNRIPRYVTRELEAQGYEVVRSPYTFGFAAVHGIRVTDKGLDGGADPGHDGVALAV